MAMRAMAVAEAAAGGGQGQRQLLEDSEDLPAEGRMTSSFCQDPHPWVIRALPSLPWFLHSIPTCRHPSVGAEATSKGFTRSPGLVAEGIIKRSGLEAVVKVESARKAVKAGNRSKERVKVLYMRLLERRDRWLPNILTNNRFHRG